MRCDSNSHQNATAPPCHKKAQVRITYVVQDNHKLLSSLYPGQHQTVKCLQHYIDLENRARRPGATFRILEAEVIE